MKYLISAGEKLSELYPYQKRGDPMKLFCLVGIMVSFAISACDFGKVEAQTETKSMKENNMKSIQSVTTVQPEIPPIDAVSTPQIETATFALG
jgi:hypothetical protein